MGIVEPIRDRNILIEIETLLEKKNYRDYVLFCIGINSGLRISDILALNVGDVKNKNFIQITEKKTGKYKKFPINDKLKKILKFYTKSRDLNEPLFLTRFNNRLDRHRAYIIINNACNSKIKEQNIGTHTLRKTFGYHHYKKFKDIAMLQKIFNHSSSDVTLRYIGIEQEEIYMSYKNFCL